MLVSAVICLIIWLGWCILSPAFDYPGLAMTPLMWLSWGLSGCNIPFQNPASLTAEGLLLTGVLLIVQWLFLRPASNWSIRLTRTGRPLKSSAFAAGFFASLLTVGGIATILEIPNWWSSSSFDYPFFGLAFYALFILWLIWAVVFYFYRRTGDRYNRLTRIIRGLIAGSILELIVAAPIQAMTYQRDNCYCARGSYTGLVLAGTVLVWTFGPGVILLFMREKYRHAKLAGPVCTNCQYSLHGLTCSDESACPECGKPFSQEQIIQNKSI